MGVWLGVSLIGFVLLVCFLLAKNILWPGKPKRNIQNKHVVVTGGSSGIGKAAALIAARMGAHVTIIARDIKKLKVARNEIVEACLDKDTQKVEFLSLDVGESYENVEKAFNEMEKSMGPIYMLINCAGTAICGKIEDTRSEDLNHMINLNLIGTYNCIKAVVPKMKSSRDGIIVITSSLAAFLGIFGYSAYCCTKFALRGLAESIAMELRPYNVSVTLNLPPDTDTPGFAVEELSKPLETKLISSSNELVKPEVVAEGLIQDALSEKFFSTVGFDGFILTVLCSGMSPFASIFDLILQSILMGPLRLVGACYLISFRKTIENCMKTRDKNKKSK
ncbi:3-ketodihydrosphingosine reductase [Venturia canescens]|uniref:3-ketodihydrosphingosine reductase n=1 Tax=Venturia canescens TaxID=32260 RepID=UPI001C9BDBF1|nr:3-ketodihydrosphingosine reductase [Venturia canescens]